MKKNCKSNFCLQEPGQTKRAGLTLIELMVVILIFLIISAAIFGVLSVGRQSWRTGSTQVELQQETRRAMDWMIKELRESGSSYVSITGGGSIITFQIPVNATNWGAEGVSGQSIQYLLGGLNNRQLLRRILNGYPTGTQVGTDAILANNIRSDSPPPNVLNFGDPNGDRTIISIEVTAQKDAMPGGRIMQSTLNSQVTLRN